ncbi:MAG TPA: hypothetical protein VN832_09565 [Stellaceae bacterium]|nr:hypothetical protein [Stellaceae bacterium]
MAAADTRTAAARANLSAAGIAALDPALDASANLDLLMKRGLLSDAVRFLAHSLPKREAVWWACLCARDMLPADAAPALLAAVQAAEGWVMAPSEEKRREAMVTAEAAGFRAPASWAAVAAFWSGGSMAPPNAPVVPPGDPLTGAAVAGAILLAAVQTEPQKAFEKYRRFLDYGIDIAGGGSGRERQQA